MKGFLLVLLLFSSSVLLQSQNLIPNPSFEHVNVVDSFFSKNYKAFNKEIRDWSSPTQSSPDVIHEPYIESMCLDGTNRIRKNFFIKPLTPRTGKKFVGIKVYGCGNYNTHCREYLQVRTLQKMKTGSCYAYSFYTNPLTNGSRVNNLGVAFSDTLVQDIEKEEVIDLGNRFGEEEIIKPGPGKWQEINGVIKATSDWNYMLVGNFYHDSETMEIPCKDGYRWGYYLVDDVSLVPVDCKSGKPAKDHELVVFHFDSNQYHLTEQHLNKLEKIVEMLNAASFKAIQIYGHADDKGSNEYNYTLSQKRAEEVRQFFLNAGIDNPKISIYYFGEESPISDNELNKNRRVEVKVIF